MSLDNLQNFDVQLLPGGFNGVSLAIVVAVLPPISGFFHFRNFLHQSQLKEKYDRVRGWFDQDYHRPEHYTVSHRT